MGKKTQSPSSKAYFAGRKASGKKHTRKTPGEKGGWITPEMRQAGVTTREAAQLQKLFKKNKTTGYQPPAGPVYTKRVGSFGAILKEALEVK